MNQTSAYGNTQCGRAIVHAELGEHMPDMDHHGFFADAQFAGDFLVPQASCNQFDHLELAYAENLVASSLLEACDDVGRQLGGARSHFADSIGQIVEE